MNIQRTLALISLILLTACGGGGGGSAPAPATTTTTIEGVASKGLIMNGVVTVFALNADGSKGAQLGTGSTDSFGVYSISFGNYSGPVVVEASGNYLDEATGETKTVPASAPLRAALPQTTGIVSLPVTPLTDLAVRQAVTLTAQNITAANTLISETFKVDIINTMPAAPTAAAFQAVSTTQAQKDYALILAAVSQQMSTNSSDLATTLTTMNSGITSAGMTADTAAAITSAATSFVTSNSHNQTGVTTIEGSVLQTIGATTLKLNLTLQGAAAATVKGFQTTMTLPVGASVRADAYGAVVTGVLTATNGTVLGKYSAAASTTPATLTVGLTSLATLTAGDVLVVSIDLAAGYSSLTASDFTLGSSKLVATGGTTVDGASLTIQ